MMASDSNSSTPAVGTNSLAHVTNPNLFINGKRVYGFISVRNEDRHGYSHIFGVCKKVVKIGRGDQNDIVLNNREFSRKHLTLNINEKENGELIVRIKNESVQENATCLLLTGEMLPHGGEAVLGSIAVILLKGRTFSWTLNDGNYESIFNAPNYPEVAYIYEDCQPPQLLKTEDVERSESHLDCIPAKE